MSLDAHRHKKQLGQHFLSSPGVVEKIIRAVNPKPREFIVEIGPGGGALTFPLLRAHGELTVIEFDRDLIEGLTIEGAQHGKLTIVHRDVLKVDFGKLGHGHDVEGPLRLVGNVPPGAFTPPPKVDSAVVRLVPRPAGEAGVKDATHFARTVAAAFSQRRKTLRNSLSTVCDSDAIRAAGIDPGARAEAVPVEAYVTLSNQLIDAGIQPPEADAPL